MNNVYMSIYRHIPNKNSKILIVCHDITADIKTLS